MGLITAQGKMLLFRTKIVVKESCILELTHLKKEENQFCPLSDFLVRYFCDTFSCHYTTAKNLGLIQPKLGCFSCCLVSSAALHDPPPDFVTTSPIIHTITQVGTSDLLPSKHKPHNSRYMNTVA